MSPHASSYRIPGPDALVTSETLRAFPSAHLGNRRPIRVLLPPHYARRAGERFPTIYLNDGQDVDSLSVVATLERLYDQRAIRHLIVVAVYATADRLNEYGVAGVPNAQGRGTRADAYEAFLLEEVMPAINRRYRTLAGPAHTAIAGMSLGGLAAFDLAWRHPELFGTVGVFSGSFWWRTDDRTWRTRQASRIMHRRVRGTPGRPALRMWFQAGTEDETSDRDGNGVIDAIQDTTELMDELVAKGYRPGADMTYLEIAGGRHDQATWARALPEFLTWAFPLVAGR
jgi:enterochelin esterase-like enzyme